MKRLAALFRAYLFPFSKEALFGRPGCGAVPLFRIIIFTLILFFPSFSAGASVFISSEVDPKKGTIGDRFFYIVTLKSDNGKTPRPQVKLLHPEPFEMVNVELIEGKPGKAVSKIVFTLAAFDTGRLKLPEYVYEWSDADGNIKSVKTDDIFVEVKSVIIGKEPSADAIEKEANAVRDWTVYIVPALLFLLILAAVIGFYLYYKRQRDKRNVEIPEKPYDAALRKLAQIKSENLYAKGKVKEYFSSISDVVRQYTESTCNVEAMEWTTFEFSNNFPKRIEKYKNSVISLLETCDSVKFAKAVPVETEADDSYRLAVDFVKNTAPKESLSEQKEPVLT